MRWVPKEWVVKDMTQLLKAVSKTSPLKTVDKVIFLNTGDLEAGVFCILITPPLLICQGKLKMLS